LEAESRRMARFSTLGHSPSEFRPRRPGKTLELPVTLDLRRIQNLEDSF
jgi:uncharacterized protein (DUF2126 family)